MDLQSVADMSTVRLDCALTQGEPIGDFHAAEAFGNEAENLPLSATQFSGAVL